MLNLCILFFMAFNANINIITITTLDAVKRHVIHVSSLLLANCLKMQAGAVLIV